MKTTKAAQYSNEEVRAAIEGHDYRWKVVRCQYKSPLGTWDLGVEMDYRDEYDIVPDEPKNNDRDGLIRLDMEISESVALESWSGFLEQMVRQDLENNTVLYVSVNGREVYDGT